MRFLPSPGNRLRPDWWWVSVLAITASALLLLTLRVSAQPAPAPAIDASTLQGQVDLTPYLATLADTDKSLTVAQVASPPFAGQFQPAQGSAPNFGYTDLPVWSQFAVSNPTDAPLALVVSLDVPTLSSLTLYPPEAVVDPNLAVQTGADLAYATRPLPWRGFAFPITVPPQAVSTYFLRAQTDFNIRLPLQISTPAAFAQFWMKDELWWGIALGLLFIMALYNLLVFAVVRDVDYLLLALLALAVVVSSGLNSGYFSRWLGPQLAPWYSPLLAIAILCAVSAFVAFAISYLELYRRARPAFWILVALLVVTAVGIPLILAGNYKWTVTLALAVLLPIEITIFAASIYLVVKGYRPAVYFLIAQSIPLGLGVIQSLSYLGVVPWVPVHLDATPINNLVLIMLMSLALADRVKHLQQATAQANAALAASERQLKNYLDALPFNIVVHDAKLNPVYMNETMRRQDPGVDALWEPGAELNGSPNGSPNGSTNGSTNGSASPPILNVSPWPVHVSGSDEAYPTERLPIMRAALGEAAQADDLSIVRNGKQMDVAAWSAPLKNDVGQTTAIISAFQDISERRATERELADYRERLEQKVAQRTTEIAAVNADLAQRVAELTAINAIGQRMARVTDLEPALKAVAHLGADLFQVDNVSIVLFHKQSEMLQIISSAPDSRLSRPTLPEQPLFAFNQSQSFAAALREPVVVEDLRQFNGMTETLRSLIAAGGVKRILVAPMLVRGSAIGVVTLATTQEEHQFSRNDLRVAETIAGLLAGAIDTLRLLEEERRQRHTADALRQTTLALSHSLDQATVLTAILHQLRQVLAYEGAAVLLIEGQEIKVVDAQGTSERHLGYSTLLNDPCAATQVVHSGKPLLIEETLGSEYAEQCCTALPVRSWLGAPLISAGRVIGVLSVESTRPQAFVSAAADLLATFANQAAVAVTNAQLYQQAQVAAAASERERIARDLHDAVTQTIFSASLLAETLPARLGSVPPSAQESIDLLHKLTKGALAEMRMLLLELRPEHLLVAPLPVLINQLAEAYTGRMGTPVDVHTACDSQWKPPDAVKVACYRIAQEALNNVAKHANASHITVNLAMRTEQIRLSVLDDGVGFEVSQASPERLGLSIVNERAKEVNANVWIDSEPGLGTHLHLVWSRESEGSHEDNAA